MNYRPNAFCSSCGHAYPQTNTYPRICSACGFHVWANPIPVSVVLLPVVMAGKTGLLVARRGIEPGRGKLALVGGFLEEHETWQQGGAREVFEETGVNIDPNSLEPFWFTSTHPRPNRVLLFSLAKPVSADELGPFTPNHEVLERGLVFGPGGLDELFAFPLHAEAAKKFFQEQNISGIAEFTAR